MTSNFDDVGAFHRKFGLTVSEGKPVLDSVADNTELLDFRLKFLCEELQEFCEALGLDFGDFSLYSRLPGFDPEVNDDAKAFDALIDLVYVAMGTVHLMGYPWQEGWDMVQAANMAKQRATSADDSTRGSSLDVVKPEGWQPPDIDGLLFARSFPIPQHRDAAEVVASTPKFVEFEDDGQ